MGNSIAIKDDLLLDKNLKAQEVFLFLHLVRLCDKTTGILTISGADLMTETRMTNKARMLRYLNTLIENRYIDKLDNINKKSTYKIHKEHFFK